MRTPDKQRGLTVWGLVFMVTLAAFFVLLFLRLFPPYFDNYKITEAMRSVAKEEGVRNETRLGIIKRMKRILYIDYADDVVNLNETLVVEKRTDGTSLRVSYEVIVPLAYNLSALIEFDNVVAVR